MPGINDPELKSSTCFDERWGPRGGESGRGSTPAGRCRMRAGPSLTAIRWRNRLRLVDEKGRSLSV